MILGIGTQWIRGHDLSRILGRKHHPREIFRVALSKNAASIILVHNHPSGDPSPSDGDIEVMRRVMEAGRLIGINVQDHITIGDGEFISLMEKRPL